MFWGVLRESMPASVSRHQRIPRNMRRELGREVRQGDQEFNLLKHSGFFTYHQVEHSKILHGVHFALSVLYGYQNRQRLLLCTALTDWSL